VAAGSGPQLKRKPLGGATSETPQGLIVRISPYLSFDGDCEAALRFYERCLGAKVVAMFTFAGSPMAAQVPADWGKKIMHATFSVGEQTFGAADAPPGSYTRPQGITLTLKVEAPTAADRIFEALAEKATVQMPIQETFWAHRFGMLTDQFGTPWMIQCDKPA
jgi:PhnB protein